MDSDTVSKAEKETRVKKAYSSGFVIKSILSMKKLAGILILIIFGVNASAQDNKIETLIKNTNNDQLSWICNYGCGLYLKSAAADSLIKIGKPATKTLLNHLNDTERGIIIHYILSNIWIKKIELSASTLNYEKDNIIEITYCKLNFFEKEGHLYAVQNVLDENKKAWVKMINKSNQSNNGKE
jgi:hypothetical protein